MRSEKGQLGVQGIRVSAMSPYKIKVEPIMIK